MSDYSERDDRKRFREDTISQNKKRTKKNIDEEDKGFYYGLFIQHHHKFADPVPGKICKRFDPPEGFEVLSNGMAGETFVSENREIVLKYFTYDTDAEKEYSMIESITRIAPQYTANPIEMYRDYEFFYRPYVIRMPNVGPTLQFERQQVPFTELEVIFCLLQAIHFTLLLGQKVMVWDVHEENVCVSGDGPDIQVKWIDFGFWKLCSSNRKETKSILHENVFELCLKEYWDAEGLFHERVNVILEWMRNRLKKGGTLKSTDMVVGSLIQMANRLSNLLIPRPLKGKSVLTTEYPKLLKLMNDIKGTVSSL